MKAFFGGNISQCEHLRETTFSLSELRTAPYCLSEEWLHLLGLTYCYAGKPYEDFYTCEEVLL